MVYNPGFPLKNGAAAPYGRQYEIIILVAAPPQGEMAGGLLRAMRDAIARGDSHLSPQGRSVIQGRTVYEVEGLGQQHHYFRAKGLIIRAALDEHLSDEVLKDILEFYP